ncbi:MAG TPA: hypothetical protein VM554_14195 [Acidisarcina sp.]|nr:hypothetical protein [Acidisarcina sp.]
MKKIRGSIVGRLFVSAILFAAAAVSLPAQSRNAAHPGARVLMDAHNCYPYFEWWSDRIDRALSAGTPLAIEQDLLWHVDRKSGRGWSVVSHGAPSQGNEPTLESYFFNRVRPVVEKALAHGDSSKWPLITLNLDLKSEEPEHLAAIWKMLEAHKDWITTAEKTADLHQISTLTVRPILVLTGDSDAQQKAFYEDLPIGTPLLVFGAVHTNTSDPMAAPEILEPAAADNYRRWWNNPWRVVEAGGQTKAGDWTAADDARLRALVKHAHDHNLWIRFYTLDGATKQELSCNGWFHDYNFGSKVAVVQRWRAAYRAGVDYIASDQYEQLGQFLRQSQSKR